MTRILVVDDEKNICQPCTLFFEVDGVDSDKYTSFPPYKAYLTNTPGKYKINHTKMYHVDAHNNDSMTQAHIDGRRRVIEMYDSMKKIMPGFENARFVQCADVVGVRESYQHIFSRCNNDLWLWNGHSQSRWIGERRLYYQECQLVHYTVQKPYT